MQSDHRRHDTSDKVWAILEPHLSGKRGDWGRISACNRSSGWL
jgi:hypothetical protein